MVNVDTIIAFSLIYINLERLSFEFSKCTCICTATVEVDFRLKQTPAKINLICLFKPRLSNHYMCVCKQSTRCIAETCEKFNDNTVLMSGELYNTEQIPFILS